MTEALLRVIYTLWSQLLWFYFDFATLRLYACDKKWEVIMNRPVHVLSKQQFAVHLFSQQHSAVLLDLQKIHFHYVCSIWSFRLFPPVSSISTLWMKIRQLHLTEIVLPWIHDEAAPFSVWILECRRNLLATVTSHSAYSSSSSSSFQLSLLHCLKLKFRFVFKL